VKKWMYLIISAVTLIVIISGITIMFSDRTEMQNGKITENTDVKKGKVTENSSNQNGKDTGNSNNQSENGSGTSNDLNGKVSENDNNHTITASTSSESQKGRIAQNTSNQIITTSTSSADQKGKIAENQNNQVITTSTSSGDQKGGNTSGNSNVYPSVSAAAELLKSAYERNDYSTIYQSFSNTIINQISQDQFLQSKPVGITIQNIQFNGSNTTSKIRSSVIANQPVLITFIKDGQTQTVKTNWVFVLEKGEWKFVGSDS
jgi:uncharacterized protein YxeA